MRLDVVRPKILGFISEDASAWLVAVVVLLVGGVLTGLLAWSTFNLNQLQLRQRFQLLAGERFSRVEERFQDQEQRLDSLRRFFSNSDAVTREDFDGFAKPLLRRTQAYAWAPQVSRAERPLLERSAREQGIADFSIRQLNAQGQLVLAGERDEYVPVLYSEAQGFQGSPLGYDLWAQPLRRETLERARRLDGPAVSQPLQLINVDPAYASGVLLAAPVRQNLATDKPDGYVLAIISMRQLMGDGLPSPASDNLAVRVLDLSVEGQHEVLYESSNPAANSAIAATRLLRLGDHDYQVDIRPSAVFLQSNHSAVGNLTVMGGLLSILLSVLLYVLVSQRQRALRLVEQRTEELRERERELRGTHGQLHSVLNAATQVAIIATDLRGVISTFNPGAEQMLGYSSAEVLGQLTLESLHLPRELEQRVRQLSQYYGKRIPLSQAMLVGSEGGEGVQAAREWTLVRRDGSQLVVNMLATPVLDEHGLWVGYLAICIDITERKRVHEALAARDQLLKKLTAHVPGGIYQFRMDAQGRVSFSYASDGIREIYEIDPQQLHRDATVVFERIHPQDLERVRASILYSAKHLSPWQEEYRVLLPRNRLRWVRGAATPESLPDNVVVWHGYISDISDLKRVEEELRALTVTDSLTGIHNRRYFHERLQAEVARLERSAGDLAVIMLDIDHFKRINDHHGHAAGDRVLKDVCERIRQRLRCTDVFCRLGGEEFMVLCPDTSGQQAYLVALELWQALRSSPIDGVGQVTASFGIAGWREHEGVDSLLLRADSGVYRAKQAGRDQVEKELP